MSRSSRSGLGTNQEAVRRHNLGTLLRSVHRRGHSSRAELTREMGLNRSTIGGLVVELESLGLVEHSQAVGSRSGAGRPSAGVRLSADGPFVIAVDLRVDRAIVARVGLGGRVHHRADTTFEGVARYLALLAAEGEALRWQAPAGDGERDVVFGAEGVPLEGFRLVRAT